jgi:hypothetical protein
VDTDNEMFMYPWGRLRQEMSGVWLRFTAERVISSYKTERSKHVDIG